VKNSRRLRRSTIKIPPPKSRPSANLKESFTLVSVLQHPQKIRTIRVPVESGSVALTLLFSDVLFGIGAGVWFASERIQGLGPGRDRCQVQGWKCGDFVRKESKNREKTHRKVSGERARLHLLESPPLPHVGRPAFLDILHAETRGSQDCPPGIAELGVQKHGSPR